MAEECKIKTRFDCKTDGVKVGEDIINLVVTRGLSQTIISLTLTEWSKLLANPDTQCEAFYETGIARAEKEYA